MIEFSFSFYRKENNLFRAFVRPLYPNEKKTPPFILCCELTKICLDVKFDEKRTERVPTGSTSRGGDPESFVDKKRLSTPHRYTKRW